MSDFKNYDQVVKWLGKGKKKSEGRRSRAFMLRMNAEGVVIVAHCHRVWLTLEDATYGKNPTWRLTDFAELRQNNVFTFTTDSLGIKNIANSLSSTLYKVFGLNWTRVSKGRYVISKWDVSRRDYWMDHKGPHAYEHFNGMSWDISTGKCFNPRPSILEDVNADKRKLWISQLKKFRRAVRIRVKLGVVHEMFARIDSKRGRPLHDVVAGHIFEAIKEGIVSTDLLNEIVHYTYLKSYGRHVDEARFKSTIESILSANSVQFRQKFGVLRT